jgi:hypothetical protein
MENIPAGRVQSFEAIKNLNLEVTTQVETDAGAMS